MKETHRMIRAASLVDALTGEEWELLECPICGYQEKLTHDPYRVEVLRLGEGMPTEADAVEFAELCKTPTGRAEVSRRLARIPRHVYTHVDTAELARSVGRDADEMPGQDPIQLRIGRVELGG